MLKEVEKAGRNRYLPRPGKSDPLKESSLITESSGLGKVLSEVERYSRYSTRIFLIDNVKMPTGRLELHTYFDLYVMLSHE